MDKVFWQNPYQTELKTYVTQVNGQNIQVQETIFYAFSGGQHSDCGTIGGYPVVNAEKHGCDIVYSLPRDHHLQAGDEVLITIDWETRYALMKLHFAAELVLEYVYQNYGHPRKIGADITTEKARVDFEWNDSIASHLDEIYRGVFCLISADHHIVSEFENEGKELRYWEISGFARVHCGGTHIKSTGEIGDITLKRVNIGKGKERIEIYLKP